MASPMIEASRKHPKPEDRSFAYGTAGVSSVCYLWSFSRAIAYLLSLPHVVPNESEPA
ncbi:hypothetical protein L873DRAFT_1817291 [Choiromyces venosus 120613-1]|uniref:Uncharacterized protein n=1 Tax=Choiromyces venosus 120613-1 TaxID=1336337 RepID=A0A3N4J3D3_9PEZI|nr:hypothetical protein L873DRAFT_1817291 [Choiromyces venosus 120613-1]